MELELDNLPLPYSHGRMFLWRVLCICMYNCTRGGVNVNPGIRVFCHSAGTFGRESIPGSQLCNPGTRNSDSTLIFVEIAQILVEIANILVEIAQILSKLLKYCRYFPK